jgi:hypothetical protein
MNAGAKLAALNKFRSSTSVIMRQPAARVLVVYDVQVKTSEVSHVSLIINYGERPSRRRKRNFLTEVDRRSTKSGRRICSSVGPSAIIRCLIFFLTLRRVAPAVASNHSRAGVVVNFVTATGGDVEMLRSIECFYK